MPETLDEYCVKSDFVFNLAGVNRPKKQSELMAGNFGFASTLLGTLKKHVNTCPVMLSSSIQATLIGRYGESDYGRSELAGENLFFDYATDTGGVLNFEVTGDKIEAIYMLPVYTHNIINLSGTEPLVTVKLANEPLDPNHPDTF